MMQFIEGHKVIKRAGFHGDLGLGKCPDAISIGQSNYPDHVMIDGVSVPISELITAINKVNEPSEKRLSYSIYLTDYGKNLIIQQS